MVIGNYFEKRRILAHGIAVCGSGIGIVLGPLLVDWLLREFDWPSTQLLLAAIALHSLPAGALYRPLEPQVVLRRRAQPDAAALEAAAAAAETASLDNTSLPGAEHERYILGGGAGALHNASALHFSFLFSLLVSPLLNSPLTLLLSLLFTRRAGGAST